jgi:hypothetical protein
MAYPSKKFSLKKLKITYVKIGNINFKLFETYVCILFSEAGAVDVVAVVPVVAVDEAGGALVVLLDDFDFLEDIIFIIIN